MKRFFSISFLPSMALLALTALTAGSCAGGRKPSPTPNPSPTAAAPTTPAGHDIAGGTFSTVSELAHFYNQDVIAPIGVPLGSIQTEVTATGALDNYGYWILGGIGDLSVFPPTPAPIADVDSALPHNADFVEIRRSIVSVHGSDALLIHEHYSPHPDVDQFRLLWRENGSVVEVEVASAGYHGRSPTVGPDALIEIANATRVVTPSEVDTLGILRDDPSKDPLSGDVSTLSSITAATQLYGAPVFAPSSGSSAYVLNAGILRSYTVDLDATGTRRLFFMPGPKPAASEATAPGVLDFQTVEV